MVAAGIIRSAMYLAKMATRESVFEFGKWRVPVPTIWLGHNLTSQVRVWKQLPHCPGILVNASQFFSHPVILARTAKTGLTDLLNFRGPVFLDSGGFQFQQTGKCRTNASDVLEVYKLLKPDIAAALDVPLNPLASSRDNFKRWRATLDNTAFMIRCNGNIELAPVIHAYSIEQAENRCAQIRKLIAEPRVICLGSMVPLLRASYIGATFFHAKNTDNRTIQRWKFIARLVLRIRHSYPEAMLHVFGAGSLSTMYLLFLLGVDSVDSVSWRVKAGYGAIQLPGMSDRNLTGLPDSNRVRRGLGREERALLAQCLCPICINEKMYRRLQNLNSFPARAVHNAFVFISEVKLAREALLQGRLIEFVHDRLKYSPQYRNILLSAVIPALERRNPLQPSK
jgi:queuine/archaeosine tRNA-ribosyltransferase